MFILGEKSGMATRRQFGAGLIAMTSTVGSAVAAQPPIRLTVYRTPACSCCKAWVSHLEKAGFAAKVVELDDLAAIKSRAGVPGVYESCHTALAEGYFIEGHVPAPDIRRLLSEKPDGRGLAVLGMPVGSPGMEVAGMAAEAFDTLLIASDGSTRLFARH
ncbi:DUF411 domain-containing protein [Bosea sp. CRIB-10]|uniref:DUF411 domain-containing protein n=1 Tax=Bosea sp. CRIB-10 TaxID=378404 RepID=UPI001FCD309D|nr:DUF411 domain-containing protein [Bosea sp. CRIB-10]